MTTDTVEDMNDPRDARDEINADAYNDELSASAVADTPAWAVDGDAMDDLVSEQDLSPGGSWLSDGSDGEEEFDLTTLRVNFSQAEAEAESLPDLPAGRYLVAITEVKIKRSTSVKNPGKPYYNLTYTIQEGKYKNRKLYDNVMLFDGALYSYTQLAKALGNSVTAGNSNVLQPQDLMGSIFVAKVVMSPAKGEYAARNEVKGYFPAKIGVGSTSAGSNSLEP
jgi:hypothetical protein